MSKEKFIEEIKNFGKEYDGKFKISCHALMKIADKHNIKYSEAGTICNDKNIKISNCQLGCF